ncbi:MAG: metal ABC transporter substrate-binding protein [Endomicrobiales bacterium]|nr:metal ABC transporter substrate-binding protein [Endomicrobiales bacterium]
MFNSSKFKQLFLLSFLVLLPINIFSKEQPTIKAIASFYPIRIILLNVTNGVSGISVDSLAPNYSGCLHDYSLNTKDMQKLQNADLFIANGAGMENFIEKVAKTNPNLKIAKLSDGIKLIEDSYGIENSHTWVSVSNAILMTENLSQFLSNVDPKNSLLYKKNADLYKEKLGKLLTEMKQQLNQYKGRKIITFHEAFPYFASEFGLEIADVIEREPASKPSAKELVETINTVNKNKIKVLFAEPQYPADAANIIAKETGAKVYILDPVVSGELKPDAYIEIMRGNLKTLKESLSK